MKFFSIIKIKVGISETVLEMPVNATVQDLLDCLEIKFERQLKNYFKSKNGYYTFSVIVNGQNADLNVQLNNGDTVALITPVFGG